MVINKISIKQTEELLKEISEESIRFKIFQEELESININLKDIESELNLGRISRKLYREFKSLLEKERKASEAKIKDTKEKILVKIGKVNKILTDSKL